MSGFGQVEVNHKMVFFFGTDFEKFPPALSPFIHLRLAIAALQDYYFD